MVPECSTNNATTVARLASVQDAFPEFKTPSLGNSRRKCPGPNQ